MGRLSCKNCNKIDGSDFQGNVSAKYKIIKFGQIKRSITKLIESLEGVNSKNSSFWGITLKNFKEKVI